MNLSTFSHITIVIAMTISVIHAAASIGHHLVKIQKVKKSIPDADRVKWQANSCRRLTTLLGRKDFVVNKLNTLIKTTQDSKKLRPAEKAFRMQTFQIFVNELQEGSLLIFQSLHWLEQTLKGDFKDLINIKASSKQRLDALRDATLLEEKEYNTILEAEKSITDFKERMKHENHTIMEGMINDVLNEVAKAADKLERQLDDHLFDNAMHEHEKGKGDDVEAVIRLRSDEEEQPKNSSQESHGTLVDSRGNQFRLAKGQDSTIPHEDHRFIQDMVLLIVLAYVCGSVCHMFSMPSMFGYIVSGVILGPSGLNFLKSLVQLETLGQFGVFFILFSVGLEFSPAKIKKVFKVATLGSTLSMAAMILLGVLFGHVIDTSLNESAFIAACLSLSSTPLVVRFLETHKEISEEGNSYADYGTVLIGILVMQDVLLGVLIALLPTLAGQGADLGGHSQQELVIFYMLFGLKLAAKLLGLVVLGWIIAKFLVGRYFTFLRNAASKEMTVLGTVILTFLMLMVTDFLSVSMELGCFLAGVTISAQGPELAEEVENLVQPIKDFLGCLFFASIGLHVFPQFMAYELTILTSLTMAVVLFKFLIGVVVLRCLLPPSARKMKWIVSAGLAQVSEFSFMLGSRARRLGLVSREVYLLILSVTTLSLLLAPVLWRTSLWQLRVKTRQALVR